ncbi:hypothetical protein V7S43_016152 [Phytophthora oleae]|uniref:Uncharacterized protein n=1 Tax=Phytophthora oleae TaxID=2107226 RepID=A0ABD3EW95_9STRA
MSTRNVGAVLRCKSVSLASTSISFLVHFGAIDLLARGRQQLHIALGGLTARFRATHMPAGILQRLNNASNMACDPFLANYLPAIRLQRRNNAPDVAFDHVGANYWLE